MPVQHTKLNQIDVMEVLRKRGYAFHNQIGVGIRLTMPSPDPKQTFKYNGKRKRVLLVPISPKMLDEILTYARNEREAAEQIERISQGVQNAPEWSHPGAPGTGGGGPQLDAELMQRLVESRVNTAVASQSKAASAQIAELREQLEEARRELTAIKNKPARGRPPGSKNKKKGGIPRVLRDSEPELSEEEEAAFQKAMAAEARDLAGLGD